MNQQGFINIIITLVIAALVGVVVYFIPIEQTQPPPVSPPSPVISPNPAPPPNPSPTPTPPPAPPPANTGVLSVVDLNRNKDAYVGQRVRVQGRIEINVFHGAMPCQVDDPVCDTSMGARLELWQSEIVPGAENLVLLFAGKEPYSCEKTAPATYSCPPYVDNKITTVEGVWVKDQVAVGWIGYSSGQPPKPIKWADRYYLNIE